MSANNSNVESRIAFKQLAEVGEARSRDLADAGFESWSDVADTSVDTIQDALSSGGATTAKRIKGSALGHERSDVEEPTFDALQKLDQVGAQRAQQLRDAGFESIADVADSTANDIVDALEMGNLSGWVAIQIFSSAYRMMDEDDDDGSPVVDTQADVDPNVEGSVVIAGSRGFPTNILDREEVVEYVDNAIDEASFEVTEVVSGGAKGADRAGEIWADEKDIPVRTFEPNWDKHGEMAAFKRNQYMAEYADSVVALWNGDSNGTADMVGRGLDELGFERVYIYRTDTDTGYYPTSDSFADDVADLDTEQDDSSDDDDDGMSDSSSSPEFSSTPGWEDAPRGGNVVIVGAANYTDDEREDGLPDETTLFKHMEKAEATGMIDRSLGRFGISPDRFATTAQDDMGAVQVKAWGRGHAESGVWKDEKLAEKQVEFNVNDFVKMNTDDDGNTDWAAAFADRDRAMMAWADWVVVVQDGGFVFSTLNKIPEQGSAVVKRYTKLGDDQWEPEEDRGVAPDVNELQTKHGETDPVEEDPSDHAGDDYESFNQYEDSESERYNGEGEGMGSGSNFIH